MRSAFTVSILALASACSDEGSDPATPPSEAADDSEDWYEYGNGDANGDRDALDDRVGSAGAASGPTLSDRRLAVRTVVSGLKQPIAMAFLAADDFFVTEKATGRVKRVEKGKVTATVLDLPVNSAEERGLLGIALHPRFEDNGWVYLYWTESSTGKDSKELDEVGNPHSDYAPGTPRPLGNRVDRFVWDAEEQSLTFDRNLVVLHAYQADEDQPEAANHNGGVLRFEKPPADQAEDEHARLFIIIGDNGRRGLLQNLEHGPFGRREPDDQFGGPEPDDAHLTGVVLRLNDDGSVPEDNPFIEAGKSEGGDPGANLTKVYAYGIRNSFGMAVDPETGTLWESENGDDSFDEINRIEPGHNGGWVQIMGPLDRIDEYKEIETTFGSEDLQQLRWPPTNIADSSEKARLSLVRLEGSRYADPEFSWKWSVAPAALGFISDDSLGGRYEGDFVVGAAVPEPAGGYLYRFELGIKRRNLRFSDDALDDRVADNTEKYDGTESESLRFGQGFGVTTDIQTGPKGNLYVVSNTSEVVYEIYRRRED